jgi:serine/threonine protein kinase
LEATHDARDEGGHLGVVHRDLTPVNVMVDEAGMTRLLDLGIAWARERTVMTEVGLTKGTPPWMSPEQIQGKPLDARSDLYVLGVLMFDLISATPWCAPRGPDRLDELVMNDCLFARFAPREAQLREDAKARFSLTEGTVGPLIELVSTLLSPEPRGRPPRAGSARARIRGVVPNEERSRGMLGRMARGIRLAKQEEARGPAPDADATQLFHT